MKKGLKIFLVILAVLIAVFITGGIVISGMSKGLEKFLADVEITPVDLSSVNDGTYEGRTNAGIIQVKLEVDVSDHKITDIRLLKHRNGQGAAAEALLPRIIEQQKNDPDVISGATYSSLAILDAVEGALTQ